MNRRLRNRLAMLRAVVEHFDQHPDLWSATPPVADEVAAVRAARNALEAGAQDQAAADTTGLTAQKDAAREDAIDLLVDLARRVRPYARTSGDLDLLAALDPSATDWRRLPHDTFVADARAAIDRVRDALPDLAPYGVTDPDLLAAREAVAEVPRLLAVRDTTGDDGAVATDALDDVYRDALPSLANLDDLVPALVADPTFVAEYAQAREIPGD